MKNKLSSLFIALALLAGVNQAAAQLPVISSFSQNGVLVCSYLQPGTVASVEWASSLSGPWQTNWAGLDAVTVNSNGTISVTVNSNGTISVSVPMFYRVRGVAYTTNIFTSDGMALIPAGPFTMGDTLDGESDAIPTVTVNVSAFYMDTNLVSFSQWQAVYQWATTNGYGFDESGEGKAANNPVQTVNWYDVVKWCNARSQQAGLTPVYYTTVDFTQVYKSGEVDGVYANWTNSGYRLPTEAEWEKASRGGLSGQRFPWGNTISESQDNYIGDTNDFSYDLGPNGYNALFNDGVSPYTSPVGYFAPNGYGLYDMAGNVRGWCWDWYAGPPYPPGSPYLGGSDPRGPASSPSDYRVLRGGSWLNYAIDARCAMRLDSYFPSFAYSAFGLRCVKGLSNTPGGMALIPAGSFTMGDTLDGESDAIPTNVYVSAFYMDTNLVSYSQWQAVYNWATTNGYGFDHAGSGKAANNPVQTVNWWDVVKWCNARSQQEGLTQVYTNGQVDSVYANWTNSGYRLPTEAEWEKASRGGLSGQRFPWGNTISESQANYIGDTNDYSYDLGPNGYNVAFNDGVTPYTSPVGYFAPNGYGLYDMAGNVYEWCWDWYGTFYAGGSDPRGPGTGSFRVLRGGGWSDYPDRERCADRNTDGPFHVAFDIGFRCVRGL